MNCTVRSIVSVASWTATLREAALAFESHDYLQTDASKLDRTAETARQKHDFYAVYEMYY